VDERTLTRVTLSVIQDPFIDPMPRPPLGISGLLAQSRSTRSVLPMLVSIPPSIDRRVAPTPLEIGARHLRDHNLSSSPQVCMSPVSRLPCDGWCLRDPSADVPNVVGFSPSMLYVLHSSAVSAGTYVDLFGSMLRQPTFVGGI